MMCCCAESVSAGTQEDINISRRPGEPVMSVTTAQVTSFPGQISQDEFGKLFSRLEGFLGCRIVRTGTSE